MQRAEIYHRVNPAAGGLTLYGIVPVYRGVGAVQCRMIRVHTAPTAFGVKKSGIRPAGFPGIPAIQTTRGRIVLGVTSPGG